MSCERVQQSLSPFLDEALNESESQLVSLHLAGCRDCHQYSVDLMRVCDELRGLPRVPAPRDLHLQLRVIASREMARTRPIFWPGFVEAWLVRTKLRMRDLMRPLAVPAAGGLLMSVVLFVALVDTLAFPSPRNFRNDTPSGLYTQVSVDDLSPFGFSGSDLVVELTIDERGIVSDYAIPNRNVSRDELKQIGKMILFTSFNPATAFGQPISGKVLLTFHRINVRG